MYRAIGSMSMSSTDTKSRYPTGPGNVLDSSHIAISSLVISDGDHNAALRIIVRKSSFSAQKGE